MNLNNLTLKTQEAIQTAQQYAFEKKHPQIEDEHLFYGLLEVDRNVVPFLFNKLDVDIEILKGLNSKSLDKFSKVEGSTQMISQKASKNIVFFCRLASGRSASTDFYSSNERGVQKMSKKHSIF